MENKFEKLERLYNLKENGAITEKEFEEEKYKILNNSSNLSNIGENEQKEQDFTNTHPLDSGEKIIIVLKYAFMGFLLGCILPASRLGTRLAVGSGFGVAVAIFVIFAFIIGKPIQGKCPYCGTDIFSFDKNGFDCCICKKRIVVKNQNEFHKID